MTNQTARVLELIKRFNSGQKVCIEALQYDMLWEGKSIKTIRRDLDVIKAIFPNSFYRIQGEIGCYKAITNELFSNIISAQNLSLLVQTFNIANRSNLFKTLQIDSADKAILEKKVKESKDIYLFKNKPFENKTNNLELFQKLEHAIYHRKEIAIEYKPANRVIKRVIKPYKIVFMNENFYIASEVESANYQFTLFRISKIVDITFTQKEFHQKREIAQFIKDMQSPMARYQPNYREALIKVVLEVAPKKANHFKLKKHLPSQKILEEKEDGSLLLEYTITQFEEIEDLIKRWIPHIKVIEPKTLKEKICLDLQEYLNIAENN